MSQVLLSYIRRTYKWGACSSPVRKTVLIWSIAIWSFRVGHQIFHLCAVKSASWNSRTSRGWGTLTRKDNENHVLISYRSVLFPQSKGFTQKQVKVVNIHSLFHSMNNYYISTICLALAKQRKGSCEQNQTWSPMDFTEHWLDLTL